MLERATACLEQGARRLLQAPHQGAQRGRTLHPFFWNHGAANVDLPAWWALLLQDTASESGEIAQIDANNTRRCISTGAASTVVLDFLYPTKTLDLMHKLSARNTSHRKARMPADVSRKSRRYSNEAYSAMQAVVDSGAEKPRQYTLLSSEEKGDTDDANFLDPFIARTASEDVESRGRTKRQIERLYNNSVSNQDTPIQRADVAEDGLLLLESLLRKSLAQHSKCLLNLLQKKGSRLSMREIAAKLKAYYHLNRFTPVLHLYKEALDRHLDHEATPTIVRIALDFDDWKLAARAYSIYRSTLQDEAYFWKELSKVNTLDLANKTLIMANHVHGRLKRVPENSHAVNLRAFAHKFIEVVLVSTNVGQRTRIPPELLTNLLKKLRRFSSSGRLTYEQYQMFLRRILDNATGPQLHVNDSAIAAVRIYREMREKTEIIPEQGLLEDLLKLTCRTHHTAFKTIYNDLKELYDVPSFNQINDVLDALETQSDLTGFMEVVRDTQSENGTSWTLGRLAQVLNMYAKRNQAAEAQSTFDSIRPLTKEKPRIEHWRSLIAAYANADDLDSALRKIDAMRSEGIDPSIQIYQPIMDYHSRHGDISALDVLAADFVQKEWQKPSSYYRALVKAHIINLNLEEAKSTLIETLSLTFDGPRGPMWGDLVREYAKMRMRNEMDELLRIMSEAGIPDSDELYQGVMTMHGWDRQPYRVLKVMLEDMPQAGFIPNAFHYAMAMSAFISTGLARKIHWLEDLMYERGVAPDFSVNTILLRAAGRSDVHMHGAIWKQAPDQVFLSKSEAKLQELLSSSDRKDLASSESKPLIGIKNMSREDAYYCNYFLTLLTLYGSKEAGNRAGQLYDMYIDKIKSIAPDHQVSPPLKMISWLMSAHRHRHEHDEVAHGWGLALEKARTLAARPGTDSYGGEWVTPSQRYALSRPLNEYVASLFEQQRLGAVEELLRDVQRMGFALDSSNWNNYVQGLAQYGDPHAAFRVAEEQLIDGWEGWPRERGLRNRHFIGAIDWQQPREHENLRRIPSYKTMVILAQAFLALRERWMVEDRRKEGLRKLLQIAPRTVEQVALMPKRHDRFQQSFLQKG